MDYAGCPLVFVLEAIRSDRRKESAPFLKMVLRAGDTVSSDSTKVTLPSLFIAYLYREEKKERQPVYAILGE